MWFSPGTPVSSTNKTDRHDITDILLKVALNIINLTHPSSVFDGVFRLKFVFETGTAQSHNIGNFIKFKLSLG
jgi:hypothetical protein